MRVDNLQELVYNKGNSGIQKAMVTIIFDNSDKLQSPSGYKELDEITVFRQVENQKSQYYVNGRKATNDQVKDLFCSVQLNVNNPHFLIMQGRVMEVVNMKPIEILSLVEEASGTSQYNRKKEEALKILAKKDLKLQEIDTLMQDDVGPQLE